MCACIHERALDVLVHRHNTCNTRIKQTTTSWCWCASSSWKTIQTPVGFMCACIHEHALDVHVHRHNTQHMLHTNTTNHKSLMIMCIFTLKHDAYTSRLHICMYSRSGSRRACTQTRHQHIRYTYKTNHNSLMTMCIFTLEHDAHTSKLHACMYSPTRSRRACTQTKHTTHVIHV